jgi:DNA-binding beta-propeller fold protein YncE
MNDPTKAAPFFCHEPEVFISSGLARPVGIAVDQSTNTVFYNQDDQQQGDTYWPLSSIGIDGKNKKDLIPKLLDPQGLDYDNKKVYYVEHHGQRLGVVNEDGTDQKVLHTFSGDDYPADVKVDSAAGKIFALVERPLTTGQKLVSMEMDGSNVTVLKNDIVQAYGLTLDMHNKVVYYINGGHGGFIGNISYTGGKSGIVLGDLDYPYMLDYDPVMGKLVFSTTGVGDGTLKVCFPNGTGVETTLTLGFAPMGVVFGEVPYNPPL